MLKASGQAGMRAWQDDKENWGGDREDEKRSKKPILHQVCIVYKADQEIKFKA